MPRTLRFLVLVSLVGCNSKAGPPPIPVCPTSGQATFNGKPAAGALLVFHPAGDVALPALPRATVASDGSFRVGTNTADDGLPEGEYVITVIWTTKPHGADETVEGKSLVNPKFAKKETSTLKATVTKGADGSCVIPSLTLTR
jgi:hypothetical protein